MKQAMKAYVEKLMIRTHAAVKKYQRAKGLEVDGIVGPKTWNALLGC